MNGLFRLALTNLLVRKGRSALSLMGMAVAVILIIGLISFSIGLRALIAHSMGEIQGLQVVRKGSPDPIISTLDQNLESRLNQIPGVRFVAPEVWHLPLVIENRFSYQDGMDSVVTLIGIDPAKTRSLQTARIYLDHIQEGRFLEPQDVGRVAVLSKKIAETYKKSLGDSLLLGNESYQIIGIYHTDSIVFDRAMFTPIETVRTVRSLADGFVSTFFLEPTDPELFGDSAKLDALAQRIETSIPDIDVRTPGEVNKQASFILQKIDTFLLIITILPLVGGALAILNTMLMSFQERVREIGILKACGWTSRDILQLVLYESTILGVLGGFIGIGIGLLAAEGLDHFFLNLDPVTPAWLIVTAMGLSACIGILGGLYPAYRASRLDPIEAIQSS